MRTEIDNWKRAVVFVEGACVNGSPRVVRGVANPIISRLSRFFTKLRLSVLTAKFVKDLVNQGREPFVGFSPVTFQYLRQSSLKQVSENLESQRLQYAMKDRAQALGFQRVEVIDCDLGFSASLGARERKGFDYVISAVACGEIGIVFSRELSRLSRTDKDWCHLLEVCQIFGTLLADEQQVYDLNVLDDQLMLGIKGTLSVVELKVLRMRLLQGQEEKARRGELFKRLPVGYVLDGDGGVTKNPDLRVQEAIALVFAKFRQL